MTCTDDRRRSRVRAAGYNGIDAVSVSADRRELTVIFFGKAPDGLRPRNFHVEGGRRITGITVTAVVDCGSEDPELEDRVRLTVDRPGDLSTYHLVVDGNDFDPRYRRIAFRFAAGCNDLDCAPACDCPSETYPPVEIDYLAKDYASFRQLLLDRLSLTLPQWHERHVPDIGIALVELLAYEGDRLSYLQDGVATEAYLNTARLRTSVRRHTRLVDYRMHDGCAARAWVQLEVSGDISLDIADVSFASETEVFEPVVLGEVSLHAAHNKIALWTWGEHDCCLPAGSTSATLVDGPAGGSRELKLTPGDVVIIEEVVGPRTGAPADRDVTHRQAVRLTSVAPGFDPLFDQQLLEVGWGREDALGFALCVNSRGGVDCRDLDVAVVRGNVLLVEHGKTVTDEALDVPAREPGGPGCPDPACFGCAEVSPHLTAAPYPPTNRTFRPRIARRPITHSTPFPPERAAAEAVIEWLRDIPQAARRRIASMSDQTVDKPISPEDTQYLRTVFGDATLIRVGLTTHPGQALTELLDRFDEFLSTKLARLEQLIASACGGRLPSADRDGWELRHTWGVTGMDTSAPRFFGSAAAALATDPRAALPSVVVVDRWRDIWHPRQDLLDSSPDDRHFVAESEDDGHLRLRFGDGRNGARFPLGESVDPADRPDTVARYRIGNGTAGNVGAEAINRIMLRGIEGAGITNVRNPIPAAGGVDPEPVAAARLAAPRHARRQRLRAVTATDYAELAAQASGVQRAAATLAWTGSWYEVQVAVDALDSGSPPGWLLDDVGRSLHRYRRIGHDLAIYPAELVPLNLELCVQVRPGHLKDAVRASLLTKLGTGRDGFFHPNRLTFDTPVRVSAIIAAAASVPGVLSVQITTLERLFGPDCDALATGVLKIGALEVAQLDNDPSRPECGRLRLNLVGGR